MPVRDVRTPADPQDFETLFDRAAKPPRDFNVTRDYADTSRTYKFQDYSGTPERDPTVEYRAYFVPASVATAAEIGNLEKRKAALKLGRLAASTPTTGSGEWITVPGESFGSEEGWFMAVGVNRRGVESEPTLATTPAVKTTVTWDDSQSPAMALRVGGTAPNFAAFRNGIYALYFGVNEEVHGSVQLSHRYLAGSNLRPHVHMSFAANPAAGATVIWSLERSIASVNDVLPASSTPTATYVATGTDAYKHCVASFPEISGAGLRESSIMVFRLFRSGGTSVPEPVLLSFDLHFQVVQTGTKTEYPSP